MRTILANNMLLPILWVISCFILYKFGEKVGSVQIDKMRLSNEYILNTAINQYINVVNTSKTIVTDLVHKYVSKTKLASAITDINKEMQFPEKMFVEKLVKIISASSDYDVVKDKTKEDTLTN